ncbi:MAG: hypothetical protein JST22_20780 [Bacteroidetes bacterium]|nr:hypothetical protein [Bacteroidota bacterium]
MADTTTKLTTRVRALLERGERIHAADCRDLFEVRDITKLAKLARVPHERRFGRRAYYRDAYVAEYRGEDPEMFLSEIETVAPADAAELLLRCRWRGGEALSVWKERLALFGSGRLRGVAAIAPGFIVRLAAFEGIRPAQALEELAAAMPLLITAEEAELFDDQFRADRAPGVISVDEWIGVHRAAHALGMKTVAGMTYSTVDHSSEYAAHLDAIRALQDETGGFAAFVPMALHNRGVADFYLAAPTAAQTLRAVAVARIFLDNIHHIAIAPSHVTTEVAVVALSYGANLVDTGIAVDDVHAEEHSGEPIGALPILDESITVSYIAPPMATVRDRLAEARWTPVGLGALFQEHVSTIAA